jgi:hypothetical protein
VLQTTAGKMIFGKFDERMHAVAAAGSDKHDRPTRKSDPFSPEKSTVES